MRVVVGSVLVLAVFATAAAQDKKIDRATLLGKWTHKTEKKEPGLGTAFIEFSKDEKVALGVDFAGASEVLEGTYKLDGDKLAISMKIKGELREVKWSIKVISGDEFSLTDSEGKTTTVTKVKGKK